jgi:SAM-dependent MidA family methyltransferase
MGSPARLNLVELGPGRGTQMRDALRAVKIVPGFREALSIHLVESNATLVPLQRTALASQGVEAVWHASPDACADALAGQSAPFVIIANEFLDTCPVDQYEAQGGQFVMRGVGLDEAGALAFTLLPNRAQPVATSQGLREGQQIEIADFSFFDPIAKLMAEKPSAALFIDYGAAVASTGDTLQAVRNHRSEPPLQSPGEADLSFQVDFAGFRSVVLETPGLAVDGPVPQAQFLGRLGIVERASRLMSANPDRAAAIEASVARLIAPSGMGSRFLALGVRSEGVAPLPGFSG